MTCQTIDKVRKIRARGKLIYCTNKVRMCILRRMWDDQKRIMIDELQLKQMRRTQAHKRLNLKRLPSTFGLTPKQAQQYEEGKKSLGKLMTIEDSARDQALKSYFSLCKERAAKTFIEWRIEQARILKQNPELKRPLRLRRLVVKSPAEIKEAKLFELYMKYEHNFNACKEELIRLELEIQKDRKVPQWETLYQLVSDSEAAELYKQSHREMMQSEEEERKQETKKQLEAEIAFAGTLPENQSC